MKRIKTECIDKEVETTVKEVAEGFIADCYYDLNVINIDELEDYIDYEEISEVTEEDKINILKEAEKLYKVYRKNYIDADLNKLSNRDNIIEFLNDIIIDYLNEINDGWHLSPEETLDEILKNGNK
jgi:hypothetical protein